MAIPLDLSQLVAILSTARHLSRCCQRSRFCRLTIPQALSAIDETVAAVIIEPIQGEGGVRIPDHAFLLSPPPPLL